MAKNLGFELFPFLGLCTSEREKVAEYSQERPFRLSK